MSCKLLQVFTSLARFPQPVRRLTCPLLAFHGHANDFREVEQAEKEGLTQEEFNERMNNPDYFQIEDPHANVRAHLHAPSHTAPQ